MDINSLQLLNKKRSINFDKKAYRVIQTEVSSLMYYFTTQTTYHYRQAICI